LEGFAQNWEKEGVGKKKHVKGPAKVQSEVKRHQRGGGGGRAGKEKWEWGCNTRLGRSRPPMVKNRINEGEFAENLQSAKRPSQPG